MDENDRKKWKKDVQPTSTDLVASPNLKLQQDKQALQNQVEERKELSQLKEQVGKQDASRPEGQQKEEGTGSLKKQEVISTKSGKNSREMQDRQKLLGQLKQEVDRQSKEQATKSV